MGARILIIEDNAANRDLMIYLVEAFGHTAIAAKGGEEGIALARRHAPDLIVCDLQMPTMDGYEVARVLKHDPVLKEIPLIAVTSFAMVGDREKVLAGGFDGYLPKPINPETFVAQCMAFLKKRDGTSEAAAPQWEQPLERARVAPTRGLILAVDNSPTNVKYLDAALAPRGYEVISAATVADGLVLARERRPSLIICDLHLPDRDGFDFIGAVRADPELKHVPVLVFSATIFPEQDARRAKAKGAKHFLPRSSDITTLLAKVDALVNAALEH